jgi:6,7-dimethyl-8-ribityllumazine synthase
MTKVLVIEARFYDDLNDMLLEGIAEALDKAEVEMSILTVPGALEIPAALNMAIQSNVHYDAYVVSGLIIRGETGHYDVVVNESARGVYNLVEKHNLALGNVILTVENRDQAEARANKAEKNKGGAAAQAALHMLEIKRQYAA